MKERLACGTIWGGIYDANLQAETAAISSSIYSNAANGGKGGDVYYFSVCGGDKLSRITIGDVTGHGEKVSQISNWLYEALLKYKNQYGEHNILADLNQTVAARGLEALSTMASISYFKENGNLYFSYAGHPPAMILRHGKDTWQPANLEANSERFTNIPLGISPKAHYRQHSVPLQSGDKIVLYTDGVLEASNAQGEFFGLNRLSDILHSLYQETPEGIKKGVIEYLLDFTNGHLDHDDVTLIVVNIN